MSSSSYSSGLHDEPRGANWLLFAGILLMIGGILNAIYGISAVAGSALFGSDIDFVTGNVKTWGWINAILGFAQIAAALSIWRGGQFGRWFGIIAASLAAMGDLLSLPAYPLWSLAVLAVDVLVIYGLLAYGGQHRAL
jgi:hypothetical protein